MIGDGAVVVALVVIGRAAVEVGLGILRLKLDGPVVVGDGAARSPCGQSRYCRGCSKPGYIWVELDGAVISAGMARSNFMRV